MGVVDNPAKRGADEPRVNRRTEDVSKNPAHDDHCFVVMPFGRDGREQRWFRGWYEAVIEPAVEECGFRAVLAAGELKPSAINDDIRAHLAFDPMVVVDLGGMTPDDPPNPNVMYELGIRHALNMPLVLMAWSGQRLPFDISNQRAIQRSRELLDLEPTRSELIAFIDGAKAGHFYRPMDAVGRIASIDWASETLGADSLSRALAEEVRSLRREIMRSPLVGPKATTKTSSPYRSVSDVIGAKRRKALFNQFKEAGGDPRAWARFLSQEASWLGGEIPRKWTQDDWGRAVRAVQGAAPPLALEPPAPAAPMDLTRAELGEQSEDLGVELPTVPSEMDTDLDRRETETDNPSTDTSSDSRDL